MALDAEGFIFYNDDGNETGSTAYAAQDTNIVLPVSTPIRMRWLIDSTTGEISSFLSPFLQWKRVGDGADWQNIAIEGTTAPLTLRDSSNMTDQAATTARLTPPAGKTTSNFQTGQYREFSSFASVSGFPAVDLNYTEIEYSLTTTTVAQPTFEYEFRLLVNGVGVPSSLASPPKLTIAGRRFILRQP
jgi:hypothetical protein